MYMGAISSIGRWDGVKQSRDGSRVRPSHYHFQIPLVELCCLHNTNFCLIRGPSSQGKKLLNRGQSKNSMGSTCHGNRGKEWNDQKDVSLISRENQVVPQNLGWEGDFWNSGNSLGIFLGIAMSSINKKRQLQHSIPDKRKTSKGLDVSGMMI